MAAEVLTTLILFAKRKNGANTMGRCLMDMNESLQVRNGTSPQGNWRGAQEWSSYDDGDSRKCLNPPDPIEAFLENAGGGRPSIELARMAIQCTKRMQTQLPPPEIGGNCVFQDFMEEFQLGFDGETDRTKIFVSHSV
ncbi:unnamed protein product, partial [Gongylonema pulchrum]|uniref:PEROXIDASE_4 domain-containing protein n=1 Tax=Gongylonema pulchrum TaxID=637853 RepID=A0A183DIG7_9BILA